MKKSFHWFFYSYALVDQDIPLCSIITPTVPNRWHMEVRTPPSLIPDVVVFFSTVLSENCTKALMSGACSYRLLHSSAHSEQHFTTQRPWLRRSLGRDAQFLLLLCLFTTTGTVGTASTQTPFYISLCLPQWVAKTPFIQKWAVS